MTEKMGIKTQSSFLAKAIICLLGWTLSSGNAFAYDLLSANYDSSAQVLTLKIAYQGTGADYKNTHQFSLDFDSCFTDENPRGLVAVLNDTGWEDTGTDEILDERKFDLSAVSYCMPAMLTVRAGLTSDISVFLDK